MTVISVGLRTSVPLKATTALSIVSLNQLISTCVRETSCIKLLTVIIFDKSGVWLDGSVIQKNIFFFIKMLLFQNHSH